MLAANESGVMKNIMKNIINILLSIVFSFTFFFFSGCSKVENKTGERIVNFAVGGTPDESAFWEELVRNFEQKSGIKVTIQRQPTDTDLRRQGLVIPLKSGQADPDVFLMDVAWLGQFAASGWLKPLDIHTGKGKNPDLSVFFEKIITQADTYDEQLVALPVYVDGGLLYYRKDLLDKFGYKKPPETWAKMAEYSHEIQNELRKTNPDFFGFVWQGAQYEGLICNFLEFAASNNGGFFTDKGILSLNTKQNIEALDFMRGLIQEQKISPPNTYTEMKEEEVRNYFQSGNALFERNWPYAWKLHQSADSAVKGRVGIAPLPHFPGGTSASTLGGWHIGISKYSDAKSDSWKFVKFIVSRETQKKLALELGWSSGRKDIYKDPDILSALPHYAALAVAFDNAVARPALPYYTQLSEVIQRYANMAISGKVSAAEALAKAEDELRAIAGRYRVK